MSGVVKFPMAGVRRLWTATENAKTREPLYGQRIDPQYWKPGATPSADYEKLDDHVEQAKLPVGFWLCHDDGLYLLSNGDRAQHEPVYAEGMGPGMETWDFIRSVVGGDDFAEFVDVGWARQAWEAGDTHLCILVSPEDFRLVLPAPVKGKARRGRA
jgi:hypothetical protein